jgi:C-terminal domain of V and A type ATP synthase
MRQRAWRKHWPARSRKASPPWKPFWKPPWMNAGTGTGALGGNDRRYLSFADDFEQRFIGQGDQRRHVAQTLDLAWDCSVTAT